MDYTVDPPSYEESNNLSIEYWCKDLEKVVEPSTGDGIFSFRVESYYEGINECFEPENELLEIDVFPNPTSGLVTVNSSIFNSGDTQVSVFDMSCLLYTSPSPRDATLSRMPSSA